MKTHLFILVILAKLTFFSSAMASCGDFRLQGKIWRNPETFKFELKVFLGTVKETTYELPEKNYYKLLAYRDHAVELLAKSETEVVYFHGVITEIIKIKKILDFTPSKDDSKLVEKRACK